MTIDRLMEFVDRFGFTAFISLALMWSAFQMVRWFGRVIISGAKYTADTFQPLVEAHIELTTVASANMTTQTKVLTEMMEEQKEHRLLLEDLRASGCWAKQEPSDV